MRYLAIATITITLAMLLLAVRLANAQEGGLVRRTAAEEPNHRHRLLLRARRQRPSRRATQKRDELAAPHVLPLSFYSSGGSVRSHTTSESRSFSVILLK